MVPRILVIGRFPSQRFADPYACFLRRRPECTDAGSFETLPAYRASSHFTSYSTEADGPQVNRTGIHCIIAAVSGVLSEHTVSLILDRSVSESGDTRARSLLPTQLVFF